MKIGSLIQIISLAFLISGCHTTGRFKLLKIEVFQPAIYPPPPKNITVVTIYNNINLIKDSLGNCYKVDDNTEFDSINNDVNSKIYYDSFLNSLRQENYFDSVINIEYQYPEVEITNIGTLNSEKCDSIWNFYNCDVIYSLEYFEIHDFTDINKYRGEINMMIYFYALWDIYDRNNSQQSIFFLHKDTVTFSNYYSSQTLSDLRNDMPYLRKEISSEYGEKFTRSLIPHWTEVERLFYKSGNLQFKQAEVFAINNEWLKAAEIWKKNITNKNKNIAAKSMYNLAIACELEGNYDAAMDWVVKSFSVFNMDNPIHSYNCQQYINILATRKLERKVLEKQIK